MISIKKNFIILFVLFLFGGCQDTKNWTALDWDLAKKGRTRQEYDIALKRNKAVRHYIYEMLYIGMPEEEFVNRFTKDSTWTDSDRAYIIDHKDNQYIILELPGSTDDKARITFQDAKLIKYEKYKTGTNPWGYADNTQILINAHKSK